MSTAAIGIDVGTGGVRAIALDPSGTMLAQAEAELRSDRHEATLHEQDPNDWWRALQDVCQRVVPPGDVAGVAITSTSGTLVLADAMGRAVRPAILYDDGRSSEVGAALGVSSSFSLAKAAWVRQREPSVWEWTHWILHPADWLAGKLTGEFGVSDHSNVLKLGYDPASGAWTEATQAADLGSHRLPTVVRPGTRIGQVCPAAAGTGLRVGTPVFAGATDGMASLIASGASEAGHANTSLGTTLVWKALATEKPREAHGIYSHLHPSGLWAPGAASNTGPGVLRVEDSQFAEAEKDALAADYLPSPLAGYFLCGSGERFPFADPHATTFVEGTGANPGARHAARLQSLGFVERWGYELMQSCGAEIGPVVYTTGGAARSPIYCSMRASILGRTVALPRYPSAACGAAILAASGALFSGDVRAAIQHMVSIGAEYEPASELAARYDELYSRFREACARRGYGA